MPTATLTSDGTNTYTWNARNQLVTIGGGASASFQYDPFGRRVSKTIVGMTQFLYDGANPVQEISGTTASANLLTGGVDEYFQRTDLAGARSFLTDALGSTLALADSTGTTQTSYTFEPFGNTTTTGATTTNSFAYTGRELDATGLYFYRARYYSPSLQRFIGEDPIGFGGGINKYAYVGNSPLNWTDRLGTDKGSSGCQVPNTNSMPLGRRIKLVASGLIHVGLGGAKIGLALAAETESAGLATPIAVLVGVQGAGNFTQGITELLVGVVGDTAGDTLVNNAKGAVTVMTSPSGFLVVVTTGDMEAGAFAKGGEGVALAIPGLPDEIGVGAVELVDLVYETLDQSSGLPKKCP